MLLHAFQNLFWGWSPCIPYLRLNSFKFSYCFLLRRQYCLSSPRLVSLASLVSRAKSIAFLLLIAIYACNQAYKPQDHSVFTFAKILLSKRTEEAYQDYFTFAYQIEDFNLDIKISSHIRPHHVKLNDLYLSLPTRQWNKLHSKAF
jgi:hypothetical protein